MLARFRSLNIADRRDVLLFVVIAIVVFALTAVMAVTGTINKGFTLGLLIVAALLAAVIPAISWGRGESRPRARFMVRLGLAMQIFGVIMTPVGLYYETNPVISVPVGFAAFLSVFFGVFIAGFGGNMLAPPRV
jgi:hypothetical protein